MHGIEHFRKRLGEGNAEDIGGLRRAMLSTLLNGWGPHEDSPMWP